MCEGEISGAEINDAALMSGIFSVSGVKWLIAVSFRCPAL